MPYNQLVYGLNISTHNNYVYVGNPKTGGSSLKSALVELETRNTKSSIDYYDPKTFRDRNISPLGKLDELPTNAPLTYLIEEDFKFITMVRNPYTRLLSCYRDKILRGNQQKARILEILGYNHTYLDQHIEFNEFAYAVVQQSDYEMDPHWRLQSSQILINLLPYSFIGRFENYQNDFKMAFLEIGIEETEIPEVRHLHSTKSNSNEGCAMHYTQEVQEMVYHRYIKDFENFGYAYELPD